MTPSSLPLCASIGPRTHVADRPDVCAAVGAAFVVDLDEAALVELDARALAEQVLRERPPPDRDDDLVDGDRLLA